MGRLRGVRGLIRYLHVPRQISHGNRHVDFHSAGVRTPPNMVESLIPLWAIRLFADDLFHLDNLVSCVIDRLVPQEAAGNVYIVGQAL
jgi:hypothetical protein